MRGILGFVALTSLAGCAMASGLGPAAQNAPEPMGPNAVVADSQITEGATRGQFFVVAEINGKAVGNSIEASLAASKNKGFVLTTIVEERTVSAGQPLQVKLVARHVSPAPIQGLIGSLTSTDYYVEGVVQWTPVAGEQYVVRGVLEASGSSVWIEDVRSGARVTAPVIGVAAIQGPTPTFELPQIMVRFDCGACEVRPDAGFRIVDAYKRLAIRSGARVNADTTVEVVVDHYHARPDLARKFLAFAMKNDEIRASILAPQGTFVVEDYFRTNHLGADTLAANIGELIFEGLAKQQQLASSPQ